MLSGDAFLITPTPPPPPRPRALLGDDPGTMHACGVVRQTGSDVHAEYLIVVSGGGDIVAVPVVSALFRGE